MIIREMLLADVPAIHQMARDEEGFRVSESEASCFWSKQQLENWVNSGYDVLLVAEIDKAIVGFVLTAFHRPTGKVTWENQYILPEYRGRGIAKALIKEMIDRLRAKGATYLHFLVKSRNQEITFYEKFFEKGDEFTWFGQTL